MSDDTKVYLPEMSFAEVEDILNDVELAILPTGSNEGHGPHLPLKVDAATSTYVSVEAAKRLYPRVLVAPCLAAGHSPQHLEFPGSISLRVYFGQYIIRPFHSVHRKKLIIFVVLNKCRQRRTQSKDLRVVEVL